MSTTATATPTRAEYMAGACTFAEFYRAVNKTAGVRYSPDSPVTIQAVTALANGDEHLNSIPLSIWDRRALQAQTSLATALQKHGDCYSLAGGVCAMKQAALDAASAYDIQSSASRQHFIDTGRYLKHGEAVTS